MKIELDDQILNHPKFIRAVAKGGSAVVHLWLGLRAYCSQQLSDGFIPDDMMSEIRGPTDSRSRIRATNCLAECNLLHRADTGWYLHDYLDHSSSRDQVIAWRESNRNRKRQNRGVSQRDGKRDTTRDGRCDGKRDTTVTTSGVPTPSYSLISDLPLRGREENTREPTATEQPKSPEQIRQRQQVALGTAEPRRDSDEPKEPTPHQSGPPPTKTKPQVESVPRRGILVIPDAPTVRRPTEAQLEAVGKPLTDRAREVQNHQGDPTWLSMLTPQCWPELIEAAELFHRTWGLARPILGNYTRDKGVQAMVELYSAGVDQETLLGAIRASRGDAWFAKQANQSRVGLTMLTPEVVRRLVPKPSDAAWEAELEKLAASAAASRKKLEGQRHA